MRVCDPTSIFVKDTPKGFKEYAAAKREGEVLCEKLNAEYSQLRVIYPRLPRMQTDQTSSLLMRKATPTLQVMQEVVFQMLKQTSNFEI